jgi:aminoglycoside 3-N-acetyltransferase I
MSIFVHKIKPSEAALFRQLLGLFGRVFEDAETYEAKQPDDAYLERLLNATHVIALIAQLDNQIVGGLVAYELPKFEQNRREIYIYDLGIEENFRRLGVATTLIEALKVEARARGAYVIFVQADYGDDPAIALYTKMGIREDVMHFDIKP